MNASRATSVRPLSPACMLVGIALWAVPGAAPPPSTATPSDTTSAPAWGGVTDSGGGGFRVTPTRIVFDDRARSAELTLVNTGATPATYRVALVRMRMAEDGAITEVQDALPGEAFADSLLRFSPRQVDLEPGATQAVRIQVRRTATLASGEYRSHLVFRELPAVPDGGPGSPGAAGMSVALQPVFGIAVPVIVRHGETRAGVELRDLQLRGNQPGASPRLSLRMLRSGNRSVYGDLTVTFFGADGRPRVVGRMRGLAVYAPNPVRVVEIPLQLEPGARIAPGSLRVTYEEGAETPELLAEAELALP